jgi:hypothetical protein
MTGTPPDNGERPGSDRRSLLLWLVGFAAVVGGVSFLLTGIGRHGASPTHSSPATVAPEPTPTPLDCPSNELALVGAFNECANTVADATSTCSVSGHVLEMVLRLAGAGPDAFLLYIEVNGGFAGPGTSSYALPPWPRPLGTQADVPKVAASRTVRAPTGSWSAAFPSSDTTRARCGSRSPAFAGSNGRSGTVSAILELSAANNTTVRGSTLSLNGPWSCS